MGLLDYYKQFEGIPEEEVNRELRQQAAERKAQELTRVQRLDLSQLASPDTPHPDVISAITFTARRGLHRYPRGSELLSELSHLHDVPPERIAIGNGASSLLQSATSALMRDGQTLLTAWPSHPLFPIMARRAHGTAVPVSGGVDALLEEAPKHDTRVIALASPNNPTGELLAATEVDRLLSGLPDSVAVLLDEALVEYSTSQPHQTSLGLLTRHPRLLVFRTFSKAFGLAGLRCGYVICGPGAESLLAELSPEHGVSDLAQTGALEALRSCSKLVTRRCQTIASQRSSLTDALRQRGFEISDSQANFLWLAHPTLDGGQLAAALSDSGIIVASGAPLGEPRYIRTTIQDPQSSERLLHALESLGPS